MSAAFYLWASITVGWNGSWAASAGPSVAVRHYSESLDAQRVSVELAPCTVSYDSDARRFSLQSSLESSILAAAAEEP